MNILYYIGLDIHKKVIAYCIKAIDGRIVKEGTIDANRRALDEWVNGLPGPWIGAMEATIFTGWIYDYLTPHAVALKVAHPEMLKAITAAKKKNDRADAEKVAESPAGKSLAGMPHVAGRYPGVAENPALSHAYRSNRGQNAKQNVWPAYGSRGCIQQETPER